MRLVVEIFALGSSFVIDGVAITPELDGTILRGITRHSSITLLQAMGVPVEERKITIDEVVQAHRDGRLQECFGAGTAATIAHVARIGVDGEDLVMPEIADRKVGPALLKKLTNIRMGIEPDPYGWVEPV